MSDEPNEADDLLGQVKAAMVTRAPKDPKRSARLKYNRRKISLAQALEQMEIAIADLRAQPGTLYKSVEVEDLAAAISEFRAKTTLPTLEPLADDEMDRLFEVLANGQPWVPPSDEVMDELRVAIENAKAEGLLGDDYDEDSKREDEGEDGDRR